MKTVFKRTDTGAVMLDWSRREKERVSEQVGGYQITSKMSSRVPNYQGDNKNGKEKRELRKAGNEAFPWQKLQNVGLKCQATFGQ